jgi:hypothetical protein
MSRIYLKKWNLGFVLPRVIYFVISRCMFTHMRDTLVDGHQVCLGVFFLRVGTEYGLTRVSGHRVTDTDLRDGFPGYEVGYHIGVDR